MIEEKMYMRSGLLAICLGFALFSPAAFAQSEGNTAALDYQVVPDWLKLPEGRTDIGSMHGDIAVSSTGDAYISVLAPAKSANGAGPSPGLQVYGPDGKFLRNVPNAPSDCHGFIIRQEPEGEFLYAARLATGRPVSDPSDVTAANQSKNGLDKQVIVKMTLDGKVVLSIPPTAIPDEFKDKTPDGKPYLRMTNVAVAANGDIYATDGYATSYVHRFDRTGKYIKTFGGKAAPYSFNTLHKIAIDTRFTPNRIIGCDRANNRVVQMSLDGDFLGVVRDDMNTPAAVAIFGDYAVIAEIGLPTAKRKTGRMAEISVLDKEGKMVAAFGTNKNDDEVGTPVTDPGKWRPGIMTAPHGVAVNAHGDVFVSEFNQWGRVHRYNLQARITARQR
jgi:hypothetical protein